jgi:hypothetical protein
LVVRPGTREGVRSVEFEVREPWMLTDGDSCILTASNAASGWGTVNVEYGLELATLSAPGAAAVRERAGHFRVRFPSVGRYRAELDLGMNRLSVSAADVSEPEEPAEPKRGLAIVADFADRRLEDYAGSGIQSEADLRGLLDEMETHWDWLSRGKERMQWDIVRVTLPQRLEVGAFAWWGEFRDAVVTAAKREVNVADYDADQDGDIDGAWIIAASGNATDQDYGYLVGGASFNQGAHVFVDGQGSGSVAYGAIGNFNHEFGHNRGLPDLYGPKSNIHTLSLMAYSWDLPPHDFTAWERWQLGWLSPRFVESSTPNVSLASAHDTLDAVIIPTVREDEYFVLEYRKTPASGYGSAAPALDGIAVYHVLEGSSQQQDPPLLALVPAGDRSYRWTARADDLLYPGNPALTQPFVARSYFGNEEVFRVENVRREGAQMLFDITLAAQHPTAGGLIENGSFEDGDAGPSGWTTSGWMSWEGQWAWTTELAQSGSRAAVITAARYENDLRWERSVGGLEVGRSYQICGYLKGESIAGSAASVGGNIGVQYVGASGYLDSRHSDGGLGTFGWQRACAVFQAQTSTVTAQCRLGHWGSTVTGKLFCDGLTLEELGQAF